jgi:hypothetical protein
MAILQNPKGGRPRHRWGKDFVVKGAMIGVLPRGRAYEYGVTE